jgi:hypothetical protein
MYHIFGNFCRNRVRCVMPRIPHQCHFGHPPSVISSAARNLEPKAKISQSQPLTFVRGWLLRNDRGLDLVASKKGVSHYTHPRRCRGLLSTAPQERGFKPKNTPTQRQMVL